MEIVKTTASTLTNDQLAAGLLVGAESEKYRNSESFIELLKEAAKRLFPEAKPRKSLYYPGGGLYQFTLDGRCTCGCNVFHWETDGETVYAVCNACGEIAGVLKDQRELLDGGVWRD